MTFHNRTWTYTIFSATPPPHPQKTGISQSRKKSSNTAKPHATQRSSKLKHKDSVTELDALLAEVTLADNTCNFPQCSKHINLIGFQCKFCKTRYCMEHSLAEVHGCGDAAKLQARKDLEREAQQKGSKYYGATGIKRSQLQIKLTKKLEEKSMARQGKTDTKKKGRKTD